MTQRPKVVHSLDRQDLTSMGRHPEILRVNHQIYFEAFPVLYSGLETVDPSKGTWRYKPLEGDTQAYYYGDLDGDESFDVVYDPPLMHDATKPQKLAKFTKVLFHAKFTFPFYLPAWWYDEESGKLHFATQQRLADKLRATSTIQKFVKTLAGCSWVDHVDLDFGLVASWRIDQQSRGFKSLSEDPLYDRLKKIWHKGDIQVADIFLASGVLDPLQRLPNIRSWCVELTVEDMFDLKPLRTHERMTLDLSNASKQNR